MFLVSYSLMFNIHIGMENPIYVMLWFEHKLSKYRALQFVFEFFIWVYVALYCGELHLFWSNVFSYFKVYIFEVPSV